ncbi:hypothetical protein [Microbacterium sp. 69-10]|uniref:hypothetical protein n=1 Tax=Microbacterium sp. 69-10 TaxID=1895783 RepID=UPI0025E6B9B7|nr:hypothetical protein [Microbacterium sp. 69-10]
MAATRGMTGLLLASAVALLLAGCVGATPGGAAPATPNASPTPTRACPQIDAADLPPDCVPYDPDDAMAQNERYRDRMEMPASSRAAAEEAVDALRPALEQLRANGEVSPDSVQVALQDAGLDGIQMIGDERGTEFSANGPEGGCIFGVVSDDPLTVEVGGYVMDGGCFTPRGGH